jgi:phospholipase C
MRLLLIALVAACAVAQSDKIKNVVLLMEENRSFDHLLGWLRRERPDIDGLTGGESNPLDPATPGSKTINVSDDALYVDPYDPDHRCGVRMRHADGQQL